MQQRDQDALAAAIAKVQQQRAAAKAAAAEAWRKGGLASKATQLLLGCVTDVGSFATQLLLKPQPHGEGVLVCEGRRLLTAAAGTLVPPLLPLLALRDSGTAAMRLLSKYWDRKGVPRDAGAQSVVLCIYCPCFSSRAKLGSNSHYADAECLNIMSWCMPIIVVKR
jgi:hypothetical protein